jgi:hypothetical protein
MLSLAGLCSPEPIRGTAMKRYRITSFSFDLVVHTLTQEISEEWPDHIKESHRVAKERTISGLTDKYGPWLIEEKLQNFIDLGSSSVSILAFHNAFFGDIRNAFVIGAYYPALTGACALGERILNHLMLRLRSYYSSTPEYAAVATDKSFSNWRVLGQTLASWGVLQPAAADAFHRLAKVRNKTLHFNPAVDTNDRPLALEAIHILNEIIDTQFCCTGSVPWVQWIVPGEMYVKQSMENDPFVKEIVLPNCSHVGPFHIVTDISRGRFEIDDAFPYEDRDITDEEYAAMRKQGRDEYFARLRANAED